MVSLRIGDYEMVERNKVKIDGEIRPINHLGGNAYQVRECHTPTVIWMGNRCGDNYKGNVMDVKK